jgi:hypothetical protein
MAIMYQQQRQQPNFGLLLEILSAMTGGGEGSTTTTGSEGTPLTNIYGQGEGEMGGLAETDVNYTESSNLPTYKRSQEVSKKPQTLGSTQPSGFGALLKMLLKYIIAA